MEADKDDFEIVIDELLSSRDLSSPEVKSCLAIMEEYREVKVNGVFSEYEKKILLITLKLAIANLLFQK